MKASKREVCSRVDFTKTIPSGLGGEAGGGYNVYYLAIVSKRNMGCKRARQLAREHWSLNEAPPFRWNRRRAWRSTTGSAYVGDFVGRRGRQRIEYWAVH